MKIHEKEAAKENTRGKGGGGYQIISYTNQKATNNSTNNIGITPLHNAANHGHLEL